MIEEYITGMELTVGVIGNEEITVLPANQALSTHDILTMKKNFTRAGENQTPPLITRSTATLL